jgi:hypothetical protein
VPAGAESWQREANVALALVVGVVNGNELPATSLVVPERSDETIPSPCRRAMKKLPRAIAKDLILQQP